MKMDLSLALLLISLGFKIASTFWDISQDFYVIGEALFTAGIVMWIYENRQAKKK